jgi:DNA-binding NtrC family response regulator
LLSRWLADHILGADRRMAKVVLALQAGMPLEAARTQADAEMSGTVKGLIASVLDMYEKLSARTLDLLKEQVERNSVGAPSLSMQQIEWNHIQHVLHEYGGNISAAARNLGMHRRTLQRKLHKPPE